MKKILSFCIALSLVFLCIPCFAGMQATAVDLPSAVDLQETVHLPPIGNQGAVGCCASMAATYMQFTNAYSRYIHDLNPSVTWNPSSGDPAYCFSPRFTYNLAGAGTAWVYEILKSQGTVPQTYSAFSGGVTGAAADDNLANDWATIDGYWQIAQNYRIKNYDQVWIKDACNYEMTTSAAGQALLDRIKTSLNEGNVVVTGGYCDTWVKNLVTIVNTGTYGEAGDKAIPYSIGPLSGGHQVSIIGYDDNITCTVNGVTLKGAFKVANSWGTGWQNDGCLWMMYDAMNETSSYSALNVANRVWTMDQVVFLDWKTDLNIGVPALTADITLTTADRDGFSLSVFRTDRQTGETLSYKPYMYDKMSFRPTYGEGRNFYGVTGGTAASGTVAVNFDTLVDSIPSGKTIDDYIWGVQASPANGGSSTVTGLKLYKNGTVCYTLSDLSDTISGTVVKNYSLDEEQTVGTNLCPGVSIIPVSGSMKGSKGELFSFTVSYDSGYRAPLDGLKVQVAGALLTPDLNGVYSFTIGTDNTISASGAVCTAPGSVTVTKYGNGFESYNGTYVMLLQFKKADLDDSVLDTSSIGKSSYPYTFRVTINGVTYEFTASSYYVFTTTMLFRFPVSDQGFFPKANTSYTVTVQICCNGIPQYASSGSLVLTPTLDGFSSSCSEHTHSYTSDQQILVEGSNCTEHGTAYTYCNVDGCCAVKQVSLPVNSEVHSYSDSYTVTKNATSSSQGEYSAVCALCGETHVVGYFDAGTGDINGDGAVTVADVPLLLDYFSGKIPYSALACGGDYNEDGLCSVKDLTALLLVIAGRASF